VVLQNDNEKKKNVRKTGKTQGVKIGALARVIFAFRWGGTAIIWGRFALYISGLLQALPSQRRATRIASSLQAVYGEAIQKFIEKSG
jgi:hypothetical protein